MPKEMQSEALKRGKRNPKVDFDKLLQPVLEILHQHPCGVKLRRLFEILEAEFKNGCFF